VTSSLHSAVQMSTYHIDVRNVALRSFRDKIILPLSSRLRDRLSLPNRQDNYQETSAYQQPRLQQMYVCCLMPFANLTQIYSRLLVLTSQRRQRPVTFSLTTPAPQPTPGEAAITDLLRIVRSPRPQYNARTQTMKMGPMSPLTRAPSFLSGGLPRDRRGRIAHKQKGKGLAHLVGLGSGDDDQEMLGDETPRNGSSTHIVDFEREREFLEALRSVSSCFAP
jgi:hypothetical protein